VVLTLAPASIGVTVVASPAQRRIEQRPVRLTVGATLGDAVRASGLLVEFVSLAEWAERGALQVSVWGRPRELGSAAADGDRIELCRPLIVDPKEARRRRYRQQGDRGRVRRKRPEPDVPDPQVATGDAPER
jgi:putative ubiquitin-RnfH superfamily antitoxin RatB of RatAB toxin-antitoxin module